MDTDNNAMNGAVRLAKTAEGSSMELTGLPTPSYGSFWFSAERGVSIREVVGSKVKVTVPKTNYNKKDLLMANAGRLIKIVTEQGGMITGVVVPPPPSSKIPDAFRPNLMDSIPSPLEDSINSIPSSGSILLKTEAGHVMLQESSIQQVEFLDKDIISFPFWMVDRTRMVMHLEQPAPGKTVTVSSLSSGISWLPSYRVVLGSEGHANLQCKATIINELMVLEKVGVELISGFPALKMPGLPSPASMKQNMSSLFAALGFESPGMQYAQSFPSNYLARMRVPQPAFAMEAPTVIDPGNVRQAEDLFFYSVPDFSCKYRETVVRNLFEGTVSYRHLYTWDIPDQEGLSAWFRGSRQKGQSSPLDVWHCIQLTNTLNVPWFTGIVEFVSQDRLAGQSTLAFTNPGEHTLARLNKSMEVMTHVAEETLSFENVNGYKKYTVKGTLTMKNISSRDMDIQVNKSIIGIPGEASEGGTMNYLTRWGNSRNPDGKFLWKITLKPGKEKKLTYLYTCQD